MPLIHRAHHFLHYDTLGDPKNPPLLLIMGLAVSSRAWGRLPELMSHDFYVLSFDNRGTGGSARSGFAYRMSDLADDAAAVIEAAGLPSAHVFGISMGGMIAQELALRHPERVRSLALGATLASFRKGHRASLHRSWDLVALNLGFTAAERVARLLVSADWEARNPGGALEWIRGAEPAGFRLAMAQFLAVARHHTLERLAKLRAPTLVITGDADRLVPPRNSEVLAQLIPGARLLVLPGAGHCFPLEREEETVRALREHFLASEARAA
jgi:pimeloyl-ACP methyl ester carboxylesterase